MKKYEVYVGERVEDVLAKLRSLSKRFPKEAFFAEFNGVYIFPFDTKEMYLSKVFDKEERKFGGMNDNQQPEIPNGLLKEQLKAHPEYDYKSFAETWAFRYGENSYDALLNYLKDNQKRGGRLDIDIEITLLEKKYNYQYGENSEATNSLVVSAVRVVGDKIQGLLTECDDYVDVDLWEDWLYLDHSEVKKVLDKNPKLAEACVGLGRLGYGDVCFLLGGNDGEMQEIRRVLSENRIPYLDYDLGWGAKLSRYELDTDSIGFDSTTFFAVELEDDVNMGDRFNFHFIDHHGINQDKPSSLEQVCRILDIPMTRRMELVAANDRGYIPAMLELGATPEEIADIRLQDRAAQGVTGLDEQAAKKALDGRYYIGLPGISTVLASEETVYDGICVVRSESSRYSPITDSLYPTKRILAISDNEFCYYGPDKEKVRDLISETFGVSKEAFYSGGGENGYLGLNFEHGVLDGDLLEAALLDKSFFVGLNPDLTHITRDAHIGSDKSEGVVYWIGKNVETIEKGVFPDGVFLEMDEDSPFYSLPVSDDVCKLLSVVKGDRIIEIGGVEGGGFIVASVSCEDPRQRFAYSLDYDSEKASFVLTEGQADVLGAHGEEIKSSLAFVLPMMNEVYAPNRQEQEIREKDNGIKM